MKRILLVCALIASTFALQLGGGIASANTQVTLKLFPSKVKTSVVGSK